MKNRTLSALLAAAAIAGGCAIVPANGPYYSGDAVVVAPPPPRIEYVGRPPVVGQIWIGGFWFWTGHRHEWVPGHWEAPRRGYRWERDGDRWRPEHGPRDDDRRDWR